MEIEDGPPQSDCTGSVNNSESQDAQLSNKNNGVIMDESNVKKELEEDDASASNQCFCEKCGSKSDLAKFKSIKMENSSRDIWIYKLQCSNDSCKFWFGDSHIFEMGSFVAITEEEIMKRIEDDKVELKIDTSNTRRLRNASSDSVSTSTVNEKNSSKRRQPTTARKKSSDPKKIEENRDIPSEDDASKSESRPRRSCTIVASNTIKSKSKNKLKRERKRRKTRIIEKPTGVQTIVKTVPKTEIVRKITTNTETQTETRELLTRALVEQIIKKEILNESDDDQTFVSPLQLKKRLLVSQRIVEAQERELQELRNTDKSYKQLFSKIAKMVEKLKTTYTSNLAILKDDVLQLEQDLTASRKHLLEEITMYKEIMDSDKADRKKSFDNLKLKFDALSVKYTYQLKLVEYEKNRAEYFLRLKDTYEQKKNEAEVIAEEVNQKLSDTLYIKDNQKCSHCQISEKMKKKMTSEIASLTMSLEEAVKEKEELTQKKEKHERLCVLRKKEIDKLNYEIRTWKAHNEKLKNEMLSMATNSPDRRIRNNILASLGESPKDSTPNGGGTPKGFPTKESPFGATPECMTPTTEKEDNELSSPALNNSPNSAKKPFWEKLKATSKDNTPIHHGFASWIPKEKPNESTPVSSNNLSKGKSQILNRKAFGVTVKEEVTDEEPSSTNVPSTSKQKPVQLKSEVHETSIENGKTNSKFSGRKEKVTVDPISVKQSINPVPMKRQIVHDPKDTDDGSMKKMKEDNVTVKKNNVVPSKQSEEKNSSEGKTNSNVPKPRIKEEIVDESANSASNGELTNKNGTDIKQSEPVDKKVCVIQPAEDPDLNSGDLDFTKMSKKRRKQVMKSLRMKNLEEDEEEDSVYSALNVFGVPLTSKSKELGRMDPPFKPAKRTTPVWNNSWASNNKPTFFAPPPKPKPFVNEDSWGRPTSSATAYNSWNTYRPSLSFKNEISPMTSPKNEYHHQQQPQQPQHQPFNPLQRRPFWD